MILNQQLNNYPTPIIAVDKDGFVTAKNYITEIALPVVHVGAYASKYTNISFGKEELSRGKFCDHDCTYFTLFHKSEEKEVTLLFLSFSTFGEGLLPFDVFKLYKAKIEEIKSKENADANKERRYVRSVHNNLIKANYFNSVTKSFEMNMKKIADSEESTLLPQVLTAVQRATSYFLENIEIKYEVAPYTLYTEINEKEILNLILNSLYFSIINSVNVINIKLSKEESCALLSFEFETNATFDTWLNKDDNAVLNSSLSLAVAFEISKLHGISYSLTKESLKKNNKYTLKYNIPAKQAPNISFSASDKNTDYLNEVFLSLFFGE